MDADKISPHTLGEHTGRLQGRGAKRRRAAFSLFIFALCVYLLSASGHIVSEDGTQMFHTTRSLVREGSFAIPLANAMQGRGGRFYCRYGMAQSLAAVPFYCLGWGFASFGPQLAKRNSELVERFAASMLNPFVGALSVVLLFMLGCAVGYSSRTSLVVALLYGFGTFAWAGAKYFFSEPLQGLFLMAALLVLLRQDTQRARSLAIAGLLLGFGLLTKPATAALVPGYAAAAWWGREGWQPSRGAFKRLISFSLPLAACGLALAAYNYYRFGDPFEFGFSFQDPRSRSFSTPLGVGLYGLLLSSGKSVFLYAPAALLFFPSIGSLFRKDPTAGGLCAFVPPVLVLFYGRWVAWHGDGFWGPRYLLPAVPFLLLPVGVLLEGGVWKRRNVKIAIAAAALLGFLVQIGGVSVSYAAYFREVGAYPYKRPFYDPRFMEDVHFNPAFSPVVGHWKILVRILKGEEGWEKVSLRGKPVESRLPVSEEEAELFRRGLDLWFVYFYRAGVPLIHFVWLPIILGLGAAIFGRRLLMLPPPHLQTS